MADRDPYGLADPPNLSTLWGRVLVDELARCGLRHAVIAPGSRSTPLAFACADHPDVSDLSVIDERSAAFVALGLARATGRPAAVISTSGTAAANFLPAVTEADRAGVPLLVLTADRPARLRDAGDSQTADQTKLYGERVRWFHEVTEARLEPGSEEPSLRSLRSTAGHAWSRALGAAGPPGPVHLNLPFEKPLEPAVEGPRPGTPAPEAGLPGALPPTFDPGGVAAGRPGGAPWLEVRSTPPTAGTPHLEATAASVEWLALALAGARRPLILVGAEAGATLPAAL
ncbi:MAG: 2-succinyl-5-enolpyruvyl-6-hydroxy-3-cyclohexene-1-carboxylic-acid synthase, partial [Acidobacteriota bacterium]